MANVSAGFYDVDPISRIEGHLGVKVETNASGVITDAWAHGNLWRGFENFMLGRNTNDAITFTQRICGVCPIPHATASMFACDGVLGVSSGYITFANQDPSGNARTDGVPRAALHIRNLIYATEFVMSNITHFYHLAAPSYVQGPPIPPWTPYYNAEQFHSLLVNVDSSGNAIHAVPAQEQDTTLFADNAYRPNDLWSTVIKSYVKALKMRRLTFEAGALFAGRMPMTSAFIAGGVTNRFDTAAEFNDKCDAFRSMYTTIGEFVLTEYVPIALALSYLYPTYDNSGNGGNAYGAGCMNLLSWGAFPQTDDTVALKGGYKMAGGATTLFMQTRSDVAGAKALVTANLKEDISRSRYDDPLDQFDANDQAYPGAVTRTVPDRDKATGYSWMKAPRWMGNPCEVGPFARMVINGLYPDDGSNIVSGAYASIYTRGSGLRLTALSRDLAYGLAATGLVQLDGSGNVVDTSGNSLVATIAGLQGGYSVLDRLRARAIEALWLCIWMIGMPDVSGSAVTWPNTGWIDNLKALGYAADKYTDYAAPSGTQVSMGVSEAPRGGLAHFVTSVNQKITAYQCVVPTTWNASPKDGANGGVGAITGTPLDRATANNAAATKRGPMEMACIGVPYQDSQVNGSNSGIEVLRVAQSFDPCIACAVH